MLRNSKFEPEEIEREKGVIVEEMNMYFDTPRDLVDNVYEEVLYGDQPLGWMVLGRKDAVRAAQRETFLDYLGRWYKPDRIVVGLGGNIDGDFMGQLEELLGDLDGNGDGGPPPLKPVEADRVRVKLHTKDSDQAHLCLGVLSYPLRHRDRYALQLLAVVLGGGMSSRLFTEVRERRGLAYYVFGTNYSYTDTGTLYSQAGVDLNRIDDAISTIAGELKKMAEEQVPSDELEKARSFAKGRFVLQTESPQGLIQFGLRREVLEGGAVEPQEVLDGLDAVTAEDVQRVAQDVIGGNQLTLAVVGPFDDPERFEKLLA
jgi:predicted Zn-dependent peptidase